MTTRLKASLIATLAALPFVLLATAMWFRGNVDPFAYYVFYLRDHIYMMGAPLTLLLPLYAHNVRSLEPQDTWWGALLTGLLFIGQWIIWAQIIVSLARRCSLRKANSHVDQTTP